MKILQKLEKFGEIGREAKLKREKALSSRLTERPEILENLENFGEIEGGNKKCIWTLYSRLCLLALFWLFTASIVEAGTAPIVLWQGTTLKDTPQEACSTQHPHFTSYGVNPQPGAQSSGTYQGETYFTYRFTGSEYGECSISPGGGWYSGAYEVQACPLSEPRHYADGQMICGECAIGYHKEGEECVPDQEQCEAGKHYGEGTKPGESKTGCTGNCELTGGGGCMTTWDSITGQASTWCSGWSFTGNTCQDNDTTQAGIDSLGVGTTPNKPSDCPPQTGYAEINGVAACLPSGTVLDNGTATKTDTATGNVTTININTTINPDGSRTTTTTTNIYNNNGDLLSTATDTTTQGQFGDGKGKEEQQDLGEPPGFDSSLPDEGQIPTHTFPNPVFDTNLFQVSGACPEPITFTAMGVDLAIEFTPICELSPIIRGIILMLAAIIAIRLIVT